MAVTGLPSPGPAPAGEQDRKSGEYDEQNARDDDRGDAASGLGQYPGSAVFCSWMSGGGDVDRVVPGHEAIGAGGGD